MGRGAGPDRYVLGRSILRRYEQRTDDHEERKFLQEQPQPDSPQCRTQPSRWSRFGAVDAFLGRSQTGSGQSLLGNTRLKGRPTILSAEAYARQTEAQTEPKAVLISKNATNGEIQPRVAVPRGVEPLSPG